MVVRMISSISSADREDTLPTNSPSIYRNGPQLCYIYFLP